MMMALGEFRFSLNTAAYQGLKQSSNYPWTTQQRINHTPIHQAICKATDSLELEGIIYPHYRGGLNQIQKMRQSAQTLQPNLLVSGTGEILGKWIIKHIEESQSVFTQDGMPRKCTFTLNLERYHDDL